VKRTRIDEPVGVVIHTCMETTQGNFLYSYLYLKLAKMSCFSFYPLWLFFYKIREQEGRISSVGAGGGTGRRGEVAGNRVGDTHVCKCKNDNC
jgi:hypothetical protein